MVEEHSWDGARLGVAAVGLGVEEGQFFVAWARVRERVEYREEVVPGLRGAVFLAVGRQHDLRLAQRQRLVELLDAVRRTRLEAQALPETVLDDAHPSDERFVAFADERRYDLSCGSVP